MIHPKYQPRHVPTPGEMISKHPGQGIAAPGSLAFGVIVVEENGEYYYDPEFRIAGLHFEKIVSAGSRQGWTWKAVN